MPKTAAKGRVAGSSSAPGTVGGLLPPSDLLDQVEGIETALRRRRTVGGLGTFLVAALSVSQIVLAVYQSTVGKGTATLDFAVLARQWPLWIGVILAILLIAFWIWSGFWFEESKRAFRYTYSVAPFQN